jgi:hypothetical protein
MDFRYLTETKNEFNNFLCDILVPHLFNGISGMLEYSIQTSNMIEEKQKKNKNLQNPGVINIFKMCLNDVSSINNYEIENEYKRIKEKSNCAEWFDNLIKASFKSYVLFLTWDPKTNNSKYLDNDIYEKISLKEFIHKCYIETCEYFKENPEIFLKKGSKNDIFEIIKKCIEIAIRKALPYNEIIQEYLKINFSINNDDKQQTHQNQQQQQKQINNIRKLLDRLMNKYNAFPDRKAVITESSDKIFDDERKKEIEEIKEYIKNEEFNDDLNINSEKISNNSQRSNKSHRSQENKISVTSQRGGSLINNSKTSSDKQIFRPHSVNSKNSSLKNTSETSENFQLNNDNLSGGSRKSSKSEILSSGYQEIDQSQINSTTHIMTRSENKKKELEQVINNVETFDNQSLSSKHSKQSKYSKHSEDSRDDKVEKIYKHVGGDHRKKIEIVKNKSNSVYDKVNSIKNYFDTLVK